MRIRGGGKVRRVRPGGLGSVIVWAVGMVCVGMAASPASAVTVLTNGNSTVQVDPASQSGMSSWVVDGVEQLHQQWFWYGVGDSGGQSPISSLTLTYADAGGRTLDVLYTDPAGRFRINIFYLLSGGQPGSGASDVAETIQIDNLTGSSLALRFYQYSDFDLAGTAEGDTVVLKNANSVVQWDHSAHATLTETVMVPVATHHELGLFSDTLDKLNDPGVTAVLLDNGGPVGSGNATWTFEWDVTLAPAGLRSSSFIISKDKNLAPLMPEPLSMLGVVLGVGTLAGYIRRRRA